MEKETIIVICAIGIVSLVALMSGLLTPKCNRCDGTGEVWGECPYCDGTGWDADFGETCPLCGGQRGWESSCPTCEGLGWRVGYENTPYLGVLTALVAIAMWFFAKGPPLKGQQRDAALSRSPSSPYRR